MAQRKKLLRILLLAAFAVAAVMGATPPGIAKNPSHATCKIKKYKHCYNLEHVCPKFCPDSCHVECASCKPICGPESPTPPSAYYPSPVPESPPTSPSPSPPPKTPASPPPPVPTSPPPPPPASPPRPKTPASLPPPTPASPPPPTPSSLPPPKTPASPPPPTPASPPPTPASPPPTPASPPPKTPASPASTPASPPPSVTPASPPTSPSSPPTPTSPPTSPSSPPLSPPKPSTPPSSPPPPTLTSPPVSPPPPSTPPSYPSPPTSPSSPPAPSTPSPPPPPPAVPTPAPRTAKCKNKNYPQCYGTEYTCPKLCPGGCEVDCVTCKPVCNCDRPGSVCQDPRFIGGDGLMFYFHGKKDHHFCLVSDPKLHINARFIGKRGPRMNRDFTWVQSIAILFHPSHRLSISALKTTTWSDSLDRLSIAFDGRPISLPQYDRARWTSSASPNVSVMRVNSNTNNIEVEVSGLFKITARVVPITEEDSRIHGYGITVEDSFAHLDLGFKFYNALSRDVEGVLGRTYRPNYVSHVKIGSSMPVTGGDRDFETSNIFASDCAVSRYGQEGHTEGGQEGEDFPWLSCQSGIEGQGVVCRR